MYYLAAVFLGLITGCTSKRVEIKEKPYENKTVIETYSLDTTFKGDSLVVIFIYHGMVIGENEFYKLRIDGSNTEVDSSFGSFEYTEENGIIYSNLEWIKFREGEDIDSTLVRNLLELVKAYESEKLNGIVFDGYGLIIDQKDFRSLERRIIYLENPRTRDAIKIDSMFTNVFLNEEK